MAQKLLQHERFDSFQEFADAMLVLKTPRNASNTDVMSAARGTQGSDFIGYDTKAEGEAQMKEAHKLATTGWPEGIRKLDKALGDIPLPSPRNIRRRRIMAEHGDHIDMDRVRAGQLDTAWQRTVRQSGTGVQRVTIATSMTVSAGVGHDTLFWRGAGATKLAEALTAAGYSVRILLCMPVTPGYGSTPEMATITVKDYTAPFDTATIASAICLPATFRKLGFVWLAAGVQQRTHTGLGRVEQLQREWLEGDNGDGSTLFMVPSAGCADNATSFAGQELDASRCRRWLDECVAKLQGDAAAA